MTSLVNIHSGAKYDVSIMRPGKWGNPFVPLTDDLRARAIVSYAHWLLEQPELLKAAPIELKDKVLGCCCLPKLCHGRVLVMLADYGVQAVKTSIILAGRLT